MPPRIAIIGAGLSGLSAARHLNTHLTCHFQIFEKSRSISGRCATKTNFTSTPLDHGAPFFTLSPSLQSILGLPPLKTLPPDAIQTAALETIPQPQPLQYLTAGNSHLGHHIFPHAPIHRATVIAVHSDRTLDILLDAPHTHQTVGPFDAIICTAPLPQAANILRPPSHIADKWKAAYNPTLTALLEYDLSLTPSGSPLHSSVASQSPYAICSDLIFSMCESFKRKSSGNRAVIVAHADESFSRKYVDAEGEQWLPSIQSEVERVWRVPKEALVDAFAKRWRYARVREGWGENIGWVPCDWIGGKVFVTGDGVGVGEEVERAIRNGIAVAEELVEQMKG